MVGAKANRPLTNGRRHHDYAEQLSETGVTWSRWRNQVGAVPDMTQMIIRYATVTVMTLICKQAEHKLINTYVVMCQEVCASDNRLQWVQLTTEPVTSTERGLNYSQLL